MPQTLFIDTNMLPREATAAGGAITEILNERLAGARNVAGTLRWLAADERYEVEPLDRHQLLYLMEGAARVTLQGQTHDIATGMGLYLGPAEQATIQGAGQPMAKLFHLVVREVAR
jgi:hypothetical protein